jgi:hypothetical protein
VAGRSLHEGSLSAARAALTALSISSAEAASTEAISFSSLYEICQFAQEYLDEKISDVGFMLVILSPELDLTNSLLIKRPVGRVILRPLGAVSSTLRSAMLKSNGRVVEKDCPACKKKGELRHRGRNVNREENESGLAKHLNIKEATKWRRPWSCLDPTRFGYRQARCRDNRPIPKSPSGVRCWQALYLTITGLNCLFGAWALRRSAAQTSDIGRSLTSVRRGEHAQKASR